MLPIYKNLTPSKENRTKDRNKFSVTTTLSDIEDSILGGDISSTAVGGIRQRKSKLTVLSGSDDIQGTSHRNLDKSPPKRRVKAQRTGKFKNLVEWMIDTFKVLSLFLVLLTGLYITLRTDFSRSTTSVASLTDTAATSKLIKLHPASEFNCKDGIGVGIFNDDYCDCFDGSDEPYTSACSHLLVQNATYPCSHNLELRIYPSRIKDGVIDCPDGSDETVMIL
jgi:hypothetical protein